MRTFSRRYSTKQAGAAQRSERARGQEKNKTEIWQPPRKQARRHGHARAINACARVGGDSARGKCAARQMRTARIAGLTRARGGTARGPWPVELGGSARWSPPRSPRRRGGERFVSVGERARGPRGRQARSRRWVTAAGHGRGGVTGLVPNSEQTCYLSLQEKKNKTGLFDEK